MTSIPWRISKPTGNYLTFLSLGTEYSVPMKLTYARYKPIRRNLGGLPGQRDGFESYTVCTLYDSQLPWAYDLVTISVDPSKQHLSADRRAFSPTDADR